MFKWEKCSPSVCLPDDRHHTCIFCSFVPSVFEFGACFHQRLESDIGDEILSHSGIEYGTQEVGPRSQTDGDNLGRCLYLYSFWVNGHRRPYLHCGLC